MQLWETRGDDGLVVLCLRGHLDIDTAQAFRAAVDGLLGEPVPRIIVDLAGVTFCDSIGLGTFAYAHNACDARGGYLRLAGPTPFLVKVLNTVGLSGTVSLYESVAQAKAG